MAYIPPTFLSLLSRPTTKLHDIQGMARQKSKMQLSILVDNPIVTAGSPVSGHVEFELDRYTIIDTIKVRFRGISMTTELRYSTPSSNGVHTSPDQLKERLWHIHADITTVLFARQKDAALPAGQHRLPFIVNVPVFSRCDCVTRLEEYRDRQQCLSWTCTGAISRTVGNIPLPPSFADSRDRYVRYEIMALVERAGGREDISIARHVTVIPVTLNHSSQLVWNDLSRLAGRSSNDTFIFSLKKLRQINFKDGTLRQCKNMFRTFTLSSPKSRVQIPTKLEVNLANDGQASIMEPLKVQIHIHFQVNRILWIHSPVNIRLSSMRVAMKSFTSRLTNIERPMSVIKDILYQADALDIPLTTGSDSDSLRFRLDPLVFDDLDISKIVPGFYLLNLHYYHELEVTVGFSVNGSSNRIIECVCPIKIVSGVDYDLETERLMPPRYNVRKV
ncbi:hypothetical protein V1527DRAFT_455912 [Lipomyces starkeyi]